ncbi:MAG: type II toxin-antitoxin system death-on-curing family toxin [Bacteroidales bacterium]|nr:type II toxin-antitoxin system death-on-curing family toxin [Bacteroidales bacterium]
MENLPKYLKDDYLKNEKKIKEYSIVDNKYIKCADVLRAHYYICDYFKSTTGVQPLFGVKNINLLQSAVDRQFVGFENKVKWDELYHICATLFFGLVKNHAFHDGNKRTALLVLLYHLLKNNRTPESNQKEFEDLTLRIASNNLSKYKVSGHKKFRKKPDKEILIIAKIIKSKTRHLSHLSHSCTYREFNTLLKKQKCYMDNPQKGYIDVFAPVEKRSNIAIFGTKKKIERVYKISFKGWSKQITKKTAKEILKKCNITSEKGKDSEVFYEDAEPMYKLIEDYEGPLRRLSDK